jgi:hypothetical protein
MKLITEEEFEKKNWRGKGSSSKVFRSMMALEPGQILFIEPVDWGQRKYPPSDIARYIRKKYKRQYTVLRESHNTGWAVRRLN